MPNAPLELYASLVCANPDKLESVGYSGYEYLRQPLIDLSPRIVIQKAAQVGATVLATLRAVWFLDTQCANTMYLFPTHRSAARFSRGRFQALLERSPRLRAMFRQVRSASHMRAGPANFYCHGARSRVELMSTPVQYLTLDERDELYLGAVSSPQPWSAVELARQRLAGQRTTWEVNLSTPTIPGHGVADEYAQSDQHRYYVRCQYCAGFFTPTWPEFVCREGASSSPFFRCQLCGQAWRDGDRRLAVRHGEWRPTYAERTLRGYHFSQLLSPVATPERLVQSWHASEHSPQGLQVFHNSVLGLPYVVEGGRLEDRFLTEAVDRGGYPMQHSSQGSVMGVDVGPNWLHVVIAEPLGEGLRLVWLGAVHDWDALPKMLQRFNVHALVIDAMPETHLARRLVHSARNGALCYYAHAKPSENQWAWRGDTVVHVSRTETLDAMYELWRLGRIQAPRDSPPEFGHHLQALVRVHRVGRDGSPRAEYLDAGGADHFAHALNYCWLARKRLAPPVRFEVLAGGMLGD